MNAAKAVFSRALRGLVLACLLTQGVRPLAQTATPASTTGLELARPLDILLTVTSGAHATRHGLMPEVLRSRVEPKLAGAGIRHTNVASEARLEVRVDSDSTGSFFSLSVNLHRPVRIEAGGRSYRSAGITWHRAIQGSFNQQTNVVLAVAERFIDEFIADHQKANPGASLRGKVVASDPKWQFVVINIGADSGVTLDQEFSVERNGEVIASIVIKTVKPDHAIGNVQHTPKPLRDVLEGDEVVPSVRPL